MQARTLPKMPRGPLGRCHEARSDCSPFQKIFVSALYVSLNLHVANSLLVEKHIMFETETEVGLNRRNKLATDCIIVALHQRCQICVESFEITFKFRSFLEF